MKKFLMSDESLNSYGFKVLTKGIDISDFMRNPVMYYNHERVRGVIGRWTDIEKTTGKLFGVPLFDEKDELGAKIAGKVKDGFIKAASIGIDNVTIEKINGVDVVVKCTLKECSICDIPSNKNALMLYYNDKQVTDHKELMQLYKKQDNMKTDLKPITDVLKLSHTASVEDIVTAIDLLKNKGGVVELIDEAIKFNFIGSYEREELLELANASPNAFQKYLDKRKELTANKREEEGLKLINQAVRSAKINADSEGKVKAFWLRNFKEDFENAKIAIGQIPERVSIKSQIQEAEKSGAERASWTLSDYRKKAPLELKNNRKLYNELLKQEKEKQNTF